MKKKKFNEETTDEKHARFEHAQEEKTEEDLVEDNQVGDLIPVTQPEQTELPPLSSSLSLSSDYVNQFLNVSSDISLDG
ncbi:hypothetical protein Tco_1128989, partial [Tanacetum coccineum]